MPSRGDRAAPTFDPAQSRSLRRYFEDLERLFTRSQIVDDADKKLYACSYVPIDVADMWEMLPEYSDVQKTYDQFKEAVIKLYPGSDIGQLWTRADLFTLVIHTAQSGIHSI